MDKIKNWFSALVFSSPSVTGWLVFLITLSIALSISFVEYQLNLSAERELVNSKLNEFENLLTNVLNEGNSATKTLGLFALNQEDIIQDFDDLGKQILESNPHINVIQYLDSGTIVAVYPLKGNENVLGLNILKDSANKNEVEESIRRRDVYFSGPLQLKQGGTGIIARYPLFKEGKFIGLSAAIIYFDDLLENASLTNDEESMFVVQLSKANPNSGILENFIAQSDNTKFTGHKSSQFMAAGNWNLSVQLKKSTALSGLIWQFLFRTTISALFGILAWNFARQPDLLRKKVAEQSKELLLSNERFELATKATSEVVWDWDLETDKVYRSDIFFTMFGYNEQETAERSDFWKSLIHPDDLSAVMKELNKTLEGKDQFWQQEFRVRKADNTYAYIFDKGYIIRDTQGKAVRMIGAIQDITSGKETELKLIEANQSLSNANEELKVFASLASHDLREPLRMISSFMSLLQKKYSAELDEKANQYIAFAIDGARRMTVLINDLLDYSKMGFDQKLIEKINTEELVQEVLKLKSALIHENDATVILENLPDIRGVKIPIQILFQNLIGNSLKYIKPHTKPKIKISGKESKYFWEFSIEDDGIGIEGDYLELIFGILKRLHPKEKYPGTGMGLATCRKIVTQHGGKIWAESSPGMGSKFFFTIKKYE